MTAPLQSTSQPAPSSAAYLLTGQIGQQATNATVVISTVANSKRVTVYMDGDEFRVQIPVVSFTQGTGAAGAAVSPMAGRITNVMVKSGDVVKKGQPLATMEAMKMEHVIRSPGDGVIDRALFNAGDFVEGGKVVVTFVAQDK